MYPILSRNFYILSDQFFYFLFRMKCDIENPWRSSNLILAAWFHEVFSNTFQRSKNKNQQAKISSLLNLLHRSKGNRISHYGGNTPWRGFHYKSVRLSEAFWQKRSQIRQKYLPVLKKVLPTYFLRKAAKALVKTCWSTSLTPTDKQAGAILKINLDYILLKRL